MLPTSFKTEPFLKREMYLGLDRLDKSNLGFKAKSRFSETILSQELVDGSYTVELNLF